MARVTLALWLLVSASGCYLSHRLPGDGGVEPDAPCVPPPRAVVTIELELLRVEPAECAAVGARTERETDLSGGPLYPDCPDSRSRPTPDGCGLEIEAQCFGVEFSRVLSGVLRGPEASGLIESTTQIGIVATECHATERWRIAD